MTTAEPASQSDPVAVFATLRALPGNETALLDCVEELRKGTLDEPGNLVYEAHTSEKEPGVVRFYELYEGPDALRAHSKSETMKRVWPELSALLAEPPEIVVTDPLWPTGERGPSS